MRLLANASRRGDAVSWELTNLLLNQVPVQIHQHHGWGVNDVELPPR